MNKYVVAFWSEYTGELLQEVVEANSEVAAVLSYMQWNDPTLTNMAAIHSYATNCYTAVSVLQIQSSRSGRSGNGLQNLSAGLDSQASFH